jgi:signal transduction histidine kinase
VQQLTVYQEIADNAQAATQARLVILTRFDPVRREARMMAWSARHAGPSQHALAAATRLFPTFDPAKVVVPVDLNRYSRQVYLEGRMVLAPFLAVAAGSVDDRILQLASTIAGIRHALICPLKSGDRVLGALGFLTARELTEPQRRICEAFVRQATLTLENAHLLALLQEQVAALEASRRRITAAEERLRREIAELLHGRVQTRLLVAWHRLGECEQLLEHSPAQARTLLREVRAQLDEIREREVREASHLLHPAIIRVGLGPAIRSLAARFQEHLRVVVQQDPALAPLDDPAQNQIPEPVRLAAYRFVEEALNNVWRHAAARTVTIALERAGERQLAVRVQDDGQGFDPAQLHPGLGLSAIAARVAQVGGTWQLTSAAGQGTCLSAVFPL